LTVAITATASAQGIKPLGEFRDWAAYRTSQGGERVCYMASKPKKAEGKYKKRGDIYAMVAHRPGAKALNVVSIQAGYRYKDGSKVALKVGGRAFTLFTQGQTAWANSTADDAAIVKAMKAGSKMVVRGTSSRGTKTKDTYSLLGFTAAYKAMSRACGVK